MQISSILFGAVRYDPLSNRQLQFVEFFMCSYVAAIGLYDRDHPLNLANSLIHSILGYKAEIVKYLQKDAMDYEVYKPRYMLTMRRNGSCEAVGKQAGFVL